MTLAETSVQQLFDLTDRVVLITGASGYLGSAMSRGFEMQLQRATNLAGGHVAQAPPPAGGLTRDEAQAALLDHMQGDILPAILSKQHAPYLYTALHWCAAYGQSEAGACAHPLSPRRDLAQQAREIDPLGAGLGKGYLGDLVSRACHEGGALG